MKAEYFLQELLDLVTEASIKMEGKFRRLDK